MQRHAELLTKQRASKRTCLPLFKSARKNEGIQLSHVSTLEDMKRASM